MHEMIHTGILDKEFIFSYSRSSGPGGQHVNKVNTKVELRFHIDKSMILTDKQKNTLKEKLKSYLNQEDELIIVAQATRSQLKNKQEAIDKFYQLIHKALKPQKKRIPTSITKTAIEKRLKEKKELSEKKNRRRLDDL